MNMGDLTVESSGVATHTEYILTENSSKDNKKKKRRSRRSKQKNTLAASSSVHETCTDDTCLHKDAIESVEAQEALSIAESMDKLYIWDLLKKGKLLFSEAKVLNLGPRFMSIYIPKLDIKRCIIYDEVEGLIVEWLEATSTLLLGLSMQKPSNTKNTCRSLEEIALIINPIGLELEMNSYEPLCLPLTLHIQSAIPVALHAVGRGDGPLDIVARLYLSSYYH